MADLAYCPNCKKPVTFTTVSKKRTTELDGRRYRYDIRQAVCDICKGEATYQPFQEAAGLAFNEAVRNDLGLVSLEKICDLPKRYAIGKRPLSRVLGFGEHTYSQMMNGQAPSRAHSDLIEKAYDDPCYYRTLLEARKTEVSASTYERSIEAVDALMQNDYPDAYRVYELGRFFVYLAHGDITGKAVQKLTYYAQGFSIAFFGQPIISQMPRAWAGGPVYGQLWYEYNNDATSYFAYDAEEEYSSPFLPKEDDLIQSIYEYFGCYSGDTLAQMTHIEPPWLNARKRAGANSGDNCKEPIAEADMRTFFGRIVSDHDMKDLDDIGTYATKAFASISRGSKSRQAC